MKRYIVSLLLIAGLSAAVAQAIRGYGQFSVTNDDVDVPVVITNATTTAESVTLLGKSAPRVDNAGDVYVGPSSGNNTQAYRVPPGGEVVIQLQKGDATNLRLWYLDVTTADDGVTVIYR